MLAKRQTAFARALEELLVMPVAVPGLATALALIITYGGAGGFRTSWVFILVGHVLFTLPFMVRSVLAVLMAIDLKTLEEGAASLGASFRQRFFHIVLPNCRSGVLAGSLMVVTLSMGEFNMTWLLHTPLNKTLPVGLADAYASLRLEIASAYTLVFFIMIVPLLLAMQALSRPRVGPSSGRKRSDGHSRRPPTRSRSRCERCGKTFADGTRALEPLDLDHQRRRDGRVSRPLRLRQDHDAAHHRRPGVARRRRPGAVRRRRRHAARRSRSATSAWCSNPTRCSRT